jgi:GMP synthase-like glutamine amidotransferase
VAKPRVAEDTPPCFEGLRKADNILLYRILLPGGNTYFDAPGGYAEAGQKLYKLAMQMNQGGDFFPMLGICLGFELLTYLASNNVEHRARCYSYNETLPLEFKRGKVRIQLRVAESIWRMPVAT